MPNLDKALADLAAKLGTNVEHLWQILIMQAKVTLIVDCMWVLFGAVYIFAATRWATNYYKRNDNSLFDGEPGEAIPMVLSWVIGFVVLVGIMVCVFEIPTLIFNPEYYALHELLGAK